MLQTAAGKMIPVIHLSILVCVSIHAASATTAECERTGNVYQKLGEAEEIIKSAKERLPTNMRSSLPMDCEEILKSGERRSGVYVVWPKNRVISGPISVYCDMDIDGGGWTVIQRRGNFSRAKDYFYQDWQAYKEGFGNLEEDFWLGNDYIFALSNQKLYSIRFDLEDAEENTRYAIYDTFWIEEESSNYTLHVTGYRGDAGDAFSYHDGSKFTTKDRDNDKNVHNCARSFKAAWWYNDCQHAGLNGVYVTGKTKNQGEGLAWYDWKGKFESLATAEIKIRKHTSWVNEVATLQQICKNTC